MLILTNAGTDKLQMTRSTDADIDVHVSWVDVPSVGGTGVPGRTNTAFASAATGDFLATPAASTVRIVKHLNVRNKDAVTSCDVTILYDANGTDTELHKATLLPGEVLEYQEGIGWHVVQLVRQEVYYRRVTATYVNATTSFSDVTGLTCPVTSGKNYIFQTGLFHFANATTSGPRFAIGGVAMTGMRIGAIIMEAGGVAAAIMNGNVGDVTAVDTAVAATTDSTTTLVNSIMSGWFQPSASGTFAIRACSEVAVGAGITIAVGSWLEVMEVSS